MRESSASTRLIDYWNQQPPKVRDVLQQRLENVILDQIGAQYGQTRERIRQIEKEFQDSLRAKFRDLVPKIREILAVQKFATSNQISFALGVPDGEYLRVFVKYLGFHTFIGPASNELYFCQTKEDLKRFRKVASKHLPSLLSEFQAALLIEYPSVTLISDLISGCKDLRLSPHKFVVRATSQNRDIAYLLLQHQGQPMSVDDLLLKIDSNKKALFAQLDRDQRFLLNRADGSWTLADWGMASGNAGVQTAFEALCRVLDEFGPLRKPDLVRRAILLFPRSAARYDHLLEGPEFGVNHEGKWDQTKNGAIQILKPEPKRTSAITEAPGGFAKTRIKVDAELLRGSGVPVNRRLTWIMGLKQPSRELKFSTPGPAGEDIILARRPGSSGLSALRSFAEAMSLKEGCELEIAFSLIELRAQLRPSCRCHASI